MSALQPGLFPIHFVGIGGIGMSGIAEVFFRRGFPVSGSDAGDSDTVRRLREIGIPITLGHHAESIAGKKVVVISSAIRADNPELLEAKRLRIPVIRRAEMLGELMRGKTGVALAGTHGKTTTTSLTSCVLHDAGLDPTCVIGGKVDALGGNAKTGEGSLVIAEADESDGSFLHLPATYAVITNIDSDHLDHYGNLESIEDAFVEFANQIPFYGKVFLCADDPGIQRILPRVSKPSALYGTAPEADFQARGIEFTRTGATFQVWKREGADFVCLGSLEIPIPGHHNVLNALGVTALCLELGVAFPKIAAALSRFGGVKRRFETLFYNPEREIRIVDDYGHHPTEIAATLKAARSVWKTGRVICVFQPHRYTRTQSCLKDFQSCFALADHLLLTEIYSAGEDPIPGITGNTLAELVRSFPGNAGPVEFVPNLDGLKDRVLAMIRPGDLVLCMGAGTITRLPATLKDAIQVESADEVIA